MPLAFCVLDCELLPMDTLQILAFASGAVNKKLSAAEGHSWAAVSQAAAAGPGRGHLCDFRSSSTVF